MSRLADWFAGLSFTARWAIAIPSLAFVLIVLLATADIVMAAGRIHPGIQVGEVEIGGLDRADATERLGEELSPRLEEPVDLVFEGREWVVISQDLGASLDATGYADEAYAVGRRGDLLQRVRERASAWLGLRTIDPWIVTETTATADFLDSIEAEVGIAPMDAGIEIEGVTARLVSAIVGLEVDRELSTLSLGSAFLLEDRTVELPVRLAPVSVTDEDAMEALSLVKRWLSGPIRLSYEDEEWTVQPEEVAGWIEFQKAPVESVDSTTPIIIEGSDEESTSAGAHRMELRPVLSAEEVSSTVSPITAGAGRPAKDAEFRASSGSVSIIPSEVGIGVDFEALSISLESALFETGDARSVTLRMMALEPALSTEDAKAMGINERLAKYTTTFSSSNAPRVNNIHTLADALDGILIAPGETFSFNGTVGPRTAEKGYQEAGTIVDGRLVPTLGGGICQVCTTLFNSVFLSGLPVDERRNHSFYISSYPTGRDATVSWGGPDFKFTNDTSAWVLIATGYSRSSVTISLYGTDPGYEVEYETGAWRDIRAHAVDETEDPELDEGTKVIEEGGVDGRSITVTRRVYDGDRLVREDEFTSKYNPKVEYVRIGTKPLPEPDESTEETPAAQ